MTSKLFEHPFDLGESFEKLLCAGRLWLIVMNLNPMVPPASPSQSQTPVAAHRSTGVFHRSSRLFQADRDERRMERALPSEYIHRPLFDFPRTPLLNRDCPPFARAYPCPLWVPQRKTRAS